MKLMIIILLLLTHVLFGNSDAHIEIFAEHYPPNNMKINNKLTGISVDLLNAMLKKMNSTQSSKDVKLTNWSRAYSIVQMKKNTMLLSTTRTKQRESLFKWVGPIAKARVGLIALKSRKIKIDKISDAYKYKIGAVLKDVGESLLLNNGVEPMNIIKSKGEHPIELCFFQLDNNRIDLLSYNMQVAFYNGKDKGLDMNKYEEVYLLKDGALYFAFNKDTDDRIILKWQKALDELKENDVYANILKKYSL